MYNFGGFISNIVTNSGLLFIIGSLCILMSHLGKPNFNKETFFAGIGSIVCGIFIGVNLWLSMSTPDIKSFQGVLYDFEPDNSVASPIAQGDCYTFTNGVDPLESFYLDFGTMHKMLPEGFEPDQEYVIYYEESKKIIVRIEKAASDDSTYS